MSRVGGYFLVFVFWCLHWLPLPLIRGIGAALGFLLFHLARSRRHIADTNLRLCFPDMPESKRQQLVREHMVVFVQAMLDRPLLWWASPSRLRRLIRLSGIENLDDGSGRPVILLTPHFVGLDACGARVSMERRLACMYKNQSNPVLDAVVLAGRQRFNESVILSRREGLRKIVKALREGMPLAYATDMDFGPNDAIFVPFFGVPAATVTALPRLAALTNARVVPLVSHLTPSGYHAEVLPAWENYPSEDLEADTRRLNAFVEAHVPNQVAQYFWVHKRFKTRPPGEPGVY